MASNSFKDEIFQIACEDLCDIVNNLQQRTFSEEIDQIEKMGGDAYLLPKLKTSAKEGISTASIDSRTLAYGSNRKAIKILKSGLQLFIEACDDFTLKILIVAAVVSIVVEMIMEVDHRATAWIEGFAILLAVFISSFITTVNNYQK